MKLLIGGSPCTHWSIAQTKNRETEASGIGWELFLNYRIARDKYQPDYFLYENNKSMSPAIRAQITAELGVEPVLINSALVSAQNRQRLYWAGKRNPDGTYRQVPVELPEDRGILLRDILETGFPLREKGYALQTGHGTTAEDAIARRQRNAVAEPVAIKPLTEKEMEYMVRETKDGRNHFGFDYFHDATKDKSACVTANTHKGVPYNVLAEPVRIGTIENDARNQDHDSQQYRVYSPDGKSVTLCGNGGGLGAKTGLYATPITPPMQVNEATKLGYTVIQPGECVDLAMPQSKTRRGRAMKDKTNCLTTSCEFYEYCGTIDAPIYQVRGGMITVKGQEYPIKLRDGCYIIRKLTVRECMRLQTVPETYAFPVSPSQAYKMLGNGWTVDVIAHIMGHFEGLTAEPVEVLSMYDGMSCGHIALGKLGAEIASYHATEIDKFAIQTTQANFPDVVQLGDAFQVREDGWTYAGLTGGGLGGGGMKRTVKADYSRTCEGCRFLVTEPWLKDVQSFHCGADGRCKGYIVGIERLLPYIPAWCPELKEN